ncbi:uncharacterized protein LOC133797226 [Humulus lupulus]|uniref:uncharacterized protein LOC133797226 n=1 Tax=Humulus lupulus TaxID=3486 RepID=UPI002B40F07C|nr:uncharacterized protein LOC133797226 [Humulus lupulus]
MITQSLDIFRERNLVRGTGMGIQVYSFYSSLALSSYSWIPNKFHSLNFSRHQLPFFSPPKRSPRTKTFLRLRMTPLARAAQNPVVQRQKVVVPNKYGEKLVGLLNDTGSTEIVILCHGFRSSKESTTILNLAVALEEEGISSFRFDFAGNGESEGTFQYGNYQREADDLRSVIEHFIGANRVICGILGHSKGGDVVLLYASRYSDISAVVNVSGRYNLKRGIAERFGEDFMQTLKEKGYIEVEDKNGSTSYRVTEESMMDRLNTDIHSACLQISKDCRVLTIHGSADETIPVEDALEFSKIIKTHKLQIVEGADHRYSAHQAELASIVSEFIKESLEKNKAASGQRKVGSTMSWRALGAVCTYAACLTATTRITFEELGICPVLLLRPTTFVFRLYIYIFSL